MICYVGSVFCVLWFMFPEIIVAISKRKLEYRYILEKIESLRKRYIKKSKYLKWICISKVMYLSDSVSS